MRSDRRAAAAESERAAPRASVSDPRFAAASEYSAEHDGHVLLILERGEVVLEAGQNGHDADEAHAIEAGTHAFWGVLAAAAEEDGLLDLGEPVFVTIPEFEDDAWKRRMRIRELLRFTSGLETGLRPLPPGPERALALEMVSRPGERFQYGPSHITVLTEVLRRKLAEQNREPVGYLRERILEPIGLELSGWRARTDGDGVEPDLAQGAVLRAEDWARFGGLIANGGRWGGRTVVESEALERCLEGSPVKPGFGCGFWLNRSRRGRAGSDFYPDGPGDLVIATGAPNQRLYVVPSLDLVIVRFGGKDRGWRDRDFLERVIPVTVGASDL